MVFLSYQNEGRYGSEILHGLLNTKYIIIPVRGNGDAQFPLTMCILGGKGGILKSCPMMVLNLGMT
jgi:hypothetical protein